MNELLVQVVLIVTIYRMVHPESGSKYYWSKISEILRGRKESPDYDRFIFVRDKILKYQHITGIHINNFLQFDLRKLAHKKHKTLLKKSIDILNAPLFQK